LPQPEYENSRFMKAARLEPTDTTPIWIMRQAGRYLPEYMEVRNKVTFIELCKTPELAAEVTLSAQRILGVDAAILFADLLPILEPMGMDLEYVKGEGPVLHNVLRDVADVNRLKELEDVGELGFVYDAIKLIRKDLPADIPLLGFAGAPFTLASYAIEGGGSKNYIHTKKLMYNHPGVWKDLMERLSRSISRYLNAQIEAGCQAVQIFDSWAGCLGTADYEKYVLPYTKMVIDEITPGTPIINFLTGNPALIPLQRKAGGTVFGLDWRIDLGTAWDLLGNDVAVQGNLDPVSLYANLDVLKERAKDVLDSAGDRPGHIFNLGHGVMPDMDPVNVKALVEMVHELGQR
jgi:uroporphyrinogen decarboxylase